MVRYMDSADCGSATERIKKSVVDITVDYIMDKVSSKQWRPGTKIPTEFELMETLDVSRNSVREAIKVLEALGLLEIRRADGTYVVNYFSEKMLTPWACSLLLEDDDSLALLELRMVIERGIFSLAIQKGTEEDMKDIYNAFENFAINAEDESATSSAILNADIKYRDTICKASHNPLTARLNDLIAYASMNSRRHSIEDVIACNDRFHMVDSHRQLTEIIVQRRTADLDSVLDYCYKYWGITLQNEK
jgi:GntR family transcriptional regulator, transcriptional repressor for pyruvate dehydrogenase complex